MKGCVRSLGRGDPRGYDGRVDRDTSKRRTGSRTRTC